MQFYVKPNSNCAGLSLTTLAEIAGGEWEDAPCWRGQPIVKTGSDLAPRQIVAWSSLFGGSAVSLAAYRRLDRPALGLVGADWGLRILANDGEEVAAEPGAEHLPAGWGAALVVVYDAGDIEDADLRRCWPGERPGVE